MNPCELSKSLSPLAVSPAEAARLMGVGRTTLYAALSSGAVKSFKLGKRRLIAVAALHDWLAKAQAEGETHGQP